jgi:putative aldouronate transport system substrate-binding protein
MRTNQGKRTAIACSTLLAAATVLAACSSTEPAAKGNNGAEAPAANMGGKLSEKPVTFKWLASDRREAPIKNNWPVFQEIEKRTNIKIEFEPVPNEMAEKRQILIATNSVTDFIPVPHTDARTYGPDGVFLNLKEYMDKYGPNLKKYFDEYPEAKALVTGADGGIYSVPTREGLGFNYSWIVRQDLLDKYGIKAPANPEEFYRMLKTLKEKHPDTYPLLPERGSHNGAATLFTALLRSFSGLEGFVPLDPVSGKYVFAADHPGFKETLLFMEKLYSEKLLDPEFAILKSAQWEERMLSGKSLVTWFWKTRVQTFNDTAKAGGIIPGYQVNAMPQFAASGVKNYQYSRDIIGGTGLAISGKIKDKVEAVKFLDYLLSKEGSDFLAYGIEGKTYEIVNGKAKFLKSLGPAPYALLRGDYGIWYPDINPDHGKSREAEILSDQAQKIEDMYKPIIIQAPKPLILNEKETETQKSKLNNLTVYMEQKISEFISGRNPINDESLNAFVDQSKKLGAHELRDMYNTAYQRTYGGK